MRPGAGAAKASRAKYRLDRPAIGQDDDRAPGIEKTDHVVVVGAEAAAMRDMAQTGKAVRVPAEAIADFHTIVGRAWGKGAR